MLHRNHVKHTSGEQCAACRILHDCEMTERLPRLRGFVLLKERKLFRHALPVFQCSRFTRKEPLFEIAVKGDNPAGADHSGVADRLEITITSDNRLRRWR